MPEAIVVAEQRVEAGRDLAKPSLRPGAPGGAPFIVPIGLVIAFNLLVDLAYAWLDPRVRGKS